MTNTNNLRRDYFTGAVINTDTTGYHQYLASKKNALNNLELTSKVNNLEKDINEIKDLLLQILNK